MRPPTRTPPKLDPALLAALTHIVELAGEAVLERASCQARLKGDGTPVTDADYASEGVMLDALPGVLPGVPIVSEEFSVQPAPPRERTLVLLDPLDGTREFVAGLREYTVNLALVVEGEPVLGVVAAPGLGLLWRGGLGLGAERLQLRGSAKAIQIRTRAWPGRDPVALVSRSHLDASTEALLDACPPIRREPCGSSLKFCRVAQGDADLYPRLAPTFEWDIAAGHAVLAAAGGLVTRAGGAPLRYGEAERAFRVPDFLAFGDPAVAPRFRPAPP